MKVTHSEKRRQLQAEIEEKRRDIHRRLAAIQHRFSPRRAANSDSAAAGEEIMGRNERLAKENRNTAGRAGEQIYEAVCDNLFATAMVGVGVAWITSSVLRRLAGNGGGRMHQTKEKLSDTAETVGEKAREAAEHTRKKAESFAEEAESVGERAGEEAREVAEKSKEIVERNPLYVGGALFAIGALIGLAIPQTHSRKRAD